MKYLANNMLGLIGKKLGMSSLFDLDGNYIPVTLISVINNYLVFIKNYNINLNVFQLCFASKNIFNSKKPILGYYIKKNIYFYGLIKEFKVSNYDLHRFFIGDIIPLNIFFINQFVNVISYTLGKGFAGVIKRFKFKSGPKSHGNSKAHNLPGSIGMCQDPGRVFKGKKMPGHLGCKKNFIKNLKIIKIDFDNNIIYIKGCLSGYENSYIFIIPSSLI